MPVFMNPLAFWAISTLVVMTAIYFFRRQARDVKVSTLMFWSTVKIPAEGGRKKTTLQTPVILLIELLILIFFVLAAANPRAVVGEKLVPVVVVLDDSFSMMAGTSQTPRKEAENFLNANIFGHDFLRISLVRAGLHPELIGRTDMSGAEAKKQLENWRCNSAGADLNAAISHAHDLFSPTTRLVVVTDAIAPGQLNEDISWLAFGKPLANLAITATNRYALGDADRCFIEFSNFASQPAQLVAEIYNTENKKVYEKINQLLPARSNHRVRMTLTDSTAPVKVEVKNDPIEFDNHAWLLPVRKLPVSVAINVNSQPLKWLMQRTIETSTLGRIVASSAELIIVTENSKRFDDEQQWQLVIHNATQPVLLNGAVAVEKNHPLCVGLPKVKAAWAVQQDLPAHGFPVMSVGGVPLLETTGEVERNLGIHLNFSSEFSTLQGTPVWPVLFWNLLTWRQKYKSGPDQFNFRSGMEISVAMPTTADNLLITTPGGRQQKMSVWRRRALIDCGETGLYNLQAGSASWTVAVNLNSPAESDLTTLSRCENQFKVAQGESGRYFSDVRWWFILPALLLLMLHQLLLSRRRPGYVY